ncbi:hypothetical protein EDC94DRAFT_692448 [Helicostylum pulchrum]|nr:hypothetical protein EDC94DRAFT_692448 [Helicostylum pulchrum]
MTGHVVYACKCLNVRIHLATKYYLEGHEKYRREKFVRQEDARISGWVFELGVKGVTVEYSSLIRTSYYDTVEDPSSWITISCYNCSSGDVYSVKNRPDIKLSDPSDISSLCQGGDRIIIHQGAIFGQDIDNLQKKPNYSNTFRIVLNPDLPVNHASFEKEEGILLSQQKHVQKILKQSLLNLEDATEKRIEEYKQEQQQQLTREKEKAMYDGTILWQTMKVIANTIREEKRLLKDENIQRRRSSIRDIFGCSGGGGTTSRRLSFESSIANTSFRKKEPLGPINELPPFQRRSSLIPPNQHNLHPLAVASTHNTETNMTLPNISSKSTGSWLEDYLFTLDEDIENEARERRQSTKYIEEDNVSSVPPIASPALVSVKNEISQNRPVHPSPSPIEPTFMEEKKRKPSFIGFDCSQVDREISSQLVPNKNMMTRRKSLVNSNHVDNNINHTRYNLSSNNNLEVKEGTPPSPPNMLTLSTEKK